MNHLISNQFLDIIETALKTNNAKDITKALEVINQTREINRIETVINPLEISKLWEQECPSIINFATTLLNKYKL